MQIIEDNTKSTSYYRNLRLLEYKIKKCIKDFLSKSDGSTFNKIKFGIVDSVNPDDFTVNVKLLGSDKVTHRYQNRTNCDLKSGDKVALQLNNGDLSDAVVIFPLGNEPNDIGYRGAVINYKSGFTCTSNDGNLRVVMNSDDCLAIQVKQSDGTYKTIQNLTVQGLGATRIFTLDDPSTFAIVGWDDGTGGLHLFCNNEDFCDIISLVGEGFIITNKDRTCVYVDDNQSSFRWNNSDNSKSAQVQCNTDGVNLWKDNKLLTTFNNGVVNILNADATYQTTLGTNSNGGMTINGTNTWSGTATWGGMQLTYQNGLLTDIHEV